jgi:hypothetical protein
MKNVYLMKWNRLLFAMLLVMAGIVLVSCGGGYGGGGSYGGTMNTAAPGAFSLMAPSPASGSTVTTTPPTFGWSPSANAADYRVQVDTTGTFLATSLIINTTVGATTYTYPVTATLTAGPTYHWQIVAENIYGRAVAGPRTFTFTP